MSYTKCLSKCPHFKKSALSCASVTLILTLSQYLGFCKFTRLQKINSWQNKPCILETKKLLFSTILKKIYIIFIYKYWHYSLCKCYFEEDKICFYS